MSLTLEQLEATTKMPRAELDEMGLPLTCPTCPATLRFSPTNTEVMVDCEKCGYNDVCFPSKRLRLYQ